MAEIQLIRIKSIYGQVKGIYEVIKNFSAYSFPLQTCNNFNNLVDELTRISSSDYTNHKLSNLTVGASDDLDVDPAKINMQSLIMRLEQEYGFSREELSQQSPSIVIFNKNQNEISLQINYTINDLINRTDSEESKTRLRELKDELEKPNKNWEKIKAILIWILNFSKDLFLEILPIILQKKP